MCLHSVVPQANLLPIVTETPLESRPYPAKSPFLEPLEVSPTGSEKPLKRQPAPDTQLRGDLDRAYGGGDATIHEIRTEIHEVSRTTPALVRPPVQIPLTKGKVALVDTEDLPLLSRFHWTTLPSGNTFYAKANYKGKTVYMHRLILFGKAARGKELKVDHVDGNGLDNRRSNLRPVRHRQNVMNGVGRPRVRRSRFKGVSVTRNRSKPFRACIEVSGKQRHLGYFASEIEAACAYDRAALRHFGGYAWLNFPQAYSGSVHKIPQSHTLTFNQGVKQVVNL